MTGPLVKKYITVILHEHHAILISSSDLTFPFRNPYIEIMCHKTFSIRHILAGNKIVDHSDVVGALPVSAAPTTSSFPTEHLTSINCVKTTARRDEKYLNFGIWCVAYIRDLTVLFISTIEDFFNIKLSSYQHKHHIYTYTLFSNIIYNIYNRYVWTLMSIKGCETQSLNL